MQVYVETFDVALCVWCDEWREAACSDPECEYCLRVRLTRAWEELAPCDRAEAMRRGMATAWPPHRVPATVPSCRWQAS